MKQLLYFTLIFILGFHTKAQQLSEYAKVSILTVSSSDTELFAAFGHSTIRIEDSLLNIDKVYNYGTYNYKQPHFYLNFARGYLLYYLSVSRYSQIKKYYTYLNRKVIAQYINLDSGQTQKIFNFLENNAMPENRMYYYDYFYDNCATRIRDLFVETLGEDIFIAENYTKNPNKTIRELANYYTKEKFPWGKFAIDLCLGMPMDKVLTDTEYMYLPDYLYEGFRASNIRNIDHWTSLITSERILIESTPQNYSPPWFTPMVASSILLLLGGGFSLLYRKNNKLSRWFDFLLFFFVGVIGVFLFLLWTITDHKAAAYNLNLLWALPTHLIIAFSILRKKIKKWARFYLLFTILCLVLLILFWKLIPQELNAGLIPFICLIVVRCYAILKRQE